MVDGLLEHAFICAEGKRGIKGREAAGAVIALLMVAKALAAYAAVGQGNWNDGGEAGIAQWRHTALAANGASRRVNEVKQRLDPRQSSQGYLNGHGDRYITISIISRSDTSRNPRRWVYHQR